MSQTVAGTSLPTLGAGLVITNPLSSGYLAYLAAARALLCVVDELIIVDGGSTDDSLAVLSEWIGDDPRVTLVRNEMTHWGPGDLWDLQQLAFNINTVLQSLSTDWGYVFSADYVLDTRSAGHLRESLMELSGELWVRMSRRLNYEPGVARRNDRCMVFNLAAIRETGVPIGFGVDSTGFASDFPIEMREVAYFADRDTGVRKPMFRGPLVVARACVRCDFVAYGHFFYTMRQANHKITRWERAIVRAYGSPEARLWELRLRHHLHGARRASSSDEVLFWNHPPHAREVVHAYYRDGMMGGMRQPGGVMRTTCRSGLSQLGRIDRKARSLLAHTRRAGSPSDGLKWSSATSKDFEVLRVPMRIPLAEFVRACAER